MSASIRQPAARRRRGALARLIGMFGPEAIEQHGSEAESPPTAAEDDQGPPTLAAIGADVLRAVIDGLGSFAFVIDAVGDGRLLLTAVNRRLAQVLALAVAPSSTGIVVGEVFPGEAGELLCAHCQRCVETGVLIEAELELDLADGRCWWQLVLAPVSDAAGRVVRIIATAVDISERKRAEETLRMSERRLINAIDSISEGFALWDEHNRLVHCNSRFKEFYPTIAGVLEPGAAFDDLLCRATAANQFQVDGPLDEWIAGRLGAHRNHSGVGEEQLSDGRWLLATARQTAEGGVVCVRADITQRKQAEQAVQQSRATLQVMIDAVDEMIVMLNADGVILAINRFGARSFGMQPKSIVGRPLLHLFKPEEATRIGQVIKTVLTDRRRLQIEVHWREKCLDISIHPVVDQAGKPVAVSVFSRDITERKRTEDTLRKLTRAVDQSPAIVIITDPIGMIEYVNPRFVEITGYAAREVIGQTPALLKSGDMSADQYAQMWAALAAGRQWSGQFRNKKKDGSLFWVSTSISAVKAADGTITHYVGLQEDISERIQAEEEAREHQQQLMRYMRIATVGEMAAALAHELNQPITSVINYCQGSLIRLASGNCSVEKLMEAMQEAHGEAKRAGEIIQNVARFVRKAPDRKDATDINRIIQAVVNLARKDLQRHGIDIRLDLANNLPSVTVNVVELEQTLLNLLRNSIEAVAESPKRQKKVTVRTASVATGSLQVSVSDNGKGFPADAVEQAFDPFFTTKPEGMGMGLAICRTIIKGHGGRVWAEANPDGGATVHFTLPISEVRHVAA